MRAIAIVNQKGGCGKTTTAINLAGFLASRRRRTLVVDMDPQGHATLGLLRDAQPSRTMYDVFVHHRRDRETRLGDITRRIGEHLDLAPADILLSMVPETQSGQNGRERILAEVLDEVRPRYDYVLVDCPPHVGLLTFNALYACTEAIVPVDPSFFSLHGIGKLLETIDVLVKETGHEISARALVTLYCGRSQFARDVVDDIRRNLSGRSLQHRHQAQRQAGGGGQPWCPDRRVLHSMRRLRRLRGARGRDPPGGRREHHGSRPAGRVGADGHPRRCRLRRGGAGRPPCTSRGRLQRVGARRQRDAADRADLDEHREVAARELSLQVRRRRRVAKRSVEHCRGADALRRTQFRADPRLHCRRERAQCPLILNRRARIVQCRPRALTLQAPRARQDRSAEGSKTFRTCFCPRRPDSRGRPSVRRTRMPDARRHHRRRRLSCLPRLAHSRWGNSPWH